jgi:uncharacterized protein YhhL (DUF1145 family)
MLSSKIKDIKIRNLFNKIENKNIVNKFLFLRVIPNQKKTNIKFKVYIPFLHFFQMRILKTTLNKHDHSKTLTKYKLLY